MAISRDELPTLSFSGNLDEDVAIMREILGEDQTVIFRPFENPHDGSIRGCVIFTELLVNNIVIDQNVVRPLLEFSSETKKKGEALARELANCVI